MLFDAIEEFVVTFTPNDFAEEISAFGKDDRSFSFVLFLFLFLLLSFLFCVSSRRRRRTKRKMLSSSR